MIRWIDLACGVGMASLGLFEGLRAHQVVGRPLLAVDPWRPALEAYTLNLPMAEEVALTTSEVVVATGLPQADLLITGPPCQGDSALNRCYISAGKRQERRGWLAAAKHAAAEVGVEPGRRVVMEVVGNHWDTWAADLGAQRIRVQDHKLGGFTLRRRTFYLFGFRPVRLPLTSPGPGWGAAVPYVLERFGEDVLLATDGHARHKRLGFARPTWEPAHAVLGHGGAHQVIDPAGRQLYRFRPEDEALLSGFSDLQLVGPVRTRQIQGNGWPAAFGHLVAHLLLKDVEVL